MKGYKDCRLGRRKNKAPTGRAGRWENIIQYKRLFFLFGTFFLQSCFSKDPKDKKFILLQFQRFIIVFFSIYGLYYLLAFNGFSVKGTIAQLNGCFLCNTYLCYKILLEIYSTGFYCRLINTFWT